MANTRKKDESKPPGTGMLIFMAFSRLMDSGMGFVVMGIIFLVGLAYVFANQLESEDALKFLFHLISFKGLGGLGLLAALIMPFAFAHIQRKARAADVAEISRLRALVGKYEKLIPLEPELPLGQPSSEPKPS